MAIPQQFLSKRIPTIIGLAILFVGGIAGILLVGRQTSFLPKASPEHSPKQVKISNVTDSSFTISWITDQATTGFIRYGPTTSLGTTIADERDQLSGDTKNYRTHYVKVRGLTAGTKYYFKIGSGSGGLYDNNGTPFEITLGPRLSASSSSDVASGTVVTSAQSPAEGSIIYLNLTGAAPLSALVRSSGSWVIDLTDARSTALSELISYQSTDVATFEVVGPDGKTTTGTAPISSIQPAPAITLGQPFDFSTSNTTNTTTTTTNTTTQTRTSTDPPATGGTFDLNPIEGASTASSSGVTLLNPSFNGEELNTTMPQIKGSAPAGSTISIKVESDPVYTEDIIVGSDGTFDWTPPDDLEPGEHTITITYTDANNEQQTVTRKFVIAAPGDSQLPALTSSTSGQTVTPTPTPTPIATGSSRISQPSTSSGVPVAGAMTPTIAIFLMGFGLLGSGIYLSRRLEI